MRGVPGASLLEATSFSPRGNKTSPRRKPWDVENDNKEQQYRESELDIAAFLAELATTTTSPHPEIVAFLRAH